MKNELAEAVSCLLQNGVGLLEHTVSLAKEHSTETEFLKQKQAATQIILDLEAQLLHPIWKEHPDLDPSSPTYNRGPGRYYPGGALLVKRH